MGPITGRNQTGDVAFKRSNPLVVGLTLVRVNKGGKVSYPALQLRFVSKLVSSVGERGG